jgi:hypothetical protein
VNVVDIQESPVAQIGEYVGTQELLVVIDRFAFDLLFLPQL